MHSVSERSIGVNPICLWDYADNYVRGVGVAVGLYSNRKSGREGCGKLGERMMAGARQRDSIDQVLLDGVIDDVGIIGHVHLFQHARAISADGLYAQAQFIGDLGHAFALSQLVEDLVFTR